MSDMSIISAILVVVVAFLAGLEGILDQFQFHQPLVACTLIGAATGNLTAGIMLGGSLQMIALAWANIGAAVAPDAALASVAAAIILVKGGNFTTLRMISHFAVAGLFSQLCLCVQPLLDFVHAADCCRKVVTLLVLNVQQLSQFGGCRSFLTMLQGLQIKLQKVETLLVLNVPAALASCPSSCYPSTICSTCPWIDAWLAQPRYGCRWWYGRSRWLRHGYQHDGNS